MKKMNFGIQGFSIKTLAALFLLMISTFTVSAQKAAVLTAFAKHGIDVNILNPETLQTPDNFSYEMRQTTITSESTKIIVAKFDPTSPKPEQWTVISVDGKSPSRSDTNSFRKNQKEKATPKTDDSSYKIEKETPDALVISYKQNPGNDSKDVAFIKDCRSYMTINLRTKKIEQIQTLNEKPLKISILTAEKFNLVAKYNWNDQAKRYLSVTENLDMQAKFMGQSTPIQTITEYSNYAKK